MLSNPIEASSREQSNSRQPDCWGRMIGGGKKKPKGLTTWDERQLQQMLEKNHSTVDTGQLEGQICKMFPFETQ